MSTNRTLLWLTTQWKTQTTTFGKQVSTQLYVTDLHHKCAVKECITYYWRRWDQSVGHLMAHPIACDFVSHVRVIVLLKPQFSSRLKIVNKEDYINTRTPGGGGWFPPPPPQKTFADKRAKTAARSAAALGNTLFHSSFPHIVSKFWPRVMSGQAHQPSSRDPTSEKVWSCVKVTSLGQSPLYFQQVYKGIDV